MLKYILKLSSFVLGFCLQSKRPTSWCMCLYTLSAHKLTEIFQVPKQIISCLALLPHLNENETIPNVQTRAIPLAGIVHSLLCFHGACAAANILLHVTKHDTPYLRKCYLADRHMFDCSPTKNAISVFYSKCVLLHVRSYWSLTYCVHVNCFSKISSKYILKICVGPPQHPLPLQALTKLGF